MAYDLVQFIGYSIDTSPQDYEGGEQEYLGIDPPAADIDARCQLMLRAMEVARDNLPPPFSPIQKILKVFLAPEFFFRGNTGAYEIDDVQLAIAMLQRIAADDQWRDWLLGFGSIVGTALLEESDENEIYNFILIQEGGQAAQGPDGARVVMKELISDIDFIADALYPGGLLVGQVVELKSGPMGPGREQQQVAYDGAGVFNLHGITWAADICLDHIDGRLVESPQLPGEKEIQIQLVPSGGASITPAGVVAQDGGYVFNVDGANGSHVALVKVNDGAFNPGRKVVSVPDIDIDLPTSPPRSVKISELYADGAGNIVIYSALEIPPSLTIAGTTHRLNWPAAPPSYQFHFNVIYDAEGNFVTSLCQITGDQLDFHGHKYFMPLKLNTRDRAKNKVVIRMELRPGSEGYSHGLWCHINTIQFKFEGFAFLFNDTDVVPPETIWSLS